MSAKIIGSMFLYTDSHHSANQEKIAVDVTLKEEYLKISHPRLEMAPISCQKQGHVLYKQMDT